MREVSLEQLQQLIRSSLAAVEKQRVDGLITKAESNTQSISEITDFKSSFVELHPSLQNCLQRVCTRARAIQSPNASVTTFHYEPLSLIASRSEVRPTTTVSCATVILPRRMLLGEAASTLLWVIASLPESSPLVVVIEKPSKLFLSLFHVLGVSCALPCSGIQFLTALSADNMLTPSLAKLIRSSNAAIYNLDASPKMCAQVLLSKRAGVSVSTVALSTISGAFSGHSLLSIFTADLSTDLLTLASDLLSIVSFRFSAGHRLSLSLPQTASIRPFSMPTRADSYYRCLCSSYAHPSIHQNLIRSWTECVEILEWRQVLESPSILC